MPKDTIILEKRTGHKTHKAEYNRTENAIDWYLCECGEELPEPVEGCGG